MVTIFNYKGTLARYVSQLRILMGMRDGVEGVYEGRRA